MDTANSTPPRGDYQKAEKYIAQLCTLLEQNKIEVIHTDLKKFDPNSIQDHYRVALEDYHIEISHSKLPNSGADSYVMLFTNLKNVAAGSADKTILAYTQLSDSQFQTFKEAAQAQIEERRRKEEEKRFNDALSPIDNLLSQAKSSAAEETAVEKPAAEDKLPSYSTIASSSPATNFFTPDNKANSETPETTSSSNPYI